MTQFLEDEKNKARLLNKMILKYGAPKTDTDTVSETKTKAADPRRRVITRLNPKTG